MFPNVKIDCVFCFLLFVCVLLQKHYEHRGFSQTLATVFWAFLDAKSRVNIWAALGGQ